MSDSNRKIRHYRIYMNMYGEMLRDLSRSETYIHLIGNNGLDKFETSLRTKTEKSFKR